MCSNLLLKYLFKSICFPTTLLKNSEDTYSHVEYKIISKFSQHFVDFSAEREPRERKGTAAERDLGAGPVALTTTQRPPRRPQGLQGQSVRIARFCNIKWTVA